MQTLLFPIISFFSLFVSQSLSTSQLVQYQPFSAYILSHNKIYTPQQFTYRQQIYNARIQEFSTITSYVPAVNNFTDWTEEEMKEYLGTRQEGQMEEQGRVGVGRRLGNPLKIDWRTNHYVTTVKSQGSCGASWAFAAIGLIQSFLIIQNKQTQQIDLSQQKLLSCTANSSCESGSISPALDLVSSSCPLESQYPYQASPSPSSPICQPASSLEISTAFSKKVYKNISDLDLLSLIQDGPVAALVSADGWFNYGEGVLACENGIGGGNADHAVLIVGYTGSAYIVKNSWGTGWGMSGYAYISRDSSKNCKIGSEVYAISWGKLFSFGILWIGVILCLII